MAIEKWHVLLCDGFPNVASWEIYELSQWSELNIALEIMELNTVLSSSSACHVWWPEGIWEYLGYTTYRFLGKSMKLCVKLWILFDCQMDILWPWFLVFSPQQSHFNHLFYLDSIKPCRGMTARKCASKVPTFCLLRVRKIPWYQHCSKLRKDGEQSSDGIDTPLFDLSALTCPNRGAWPRDPFWVCRHAISGSLLSYLPLVI